MNNNKRWLLGLLLLNLVNLAIASEAHKEKLYVYGDCGRGKELASPDRKTSKRARRSCE